MKDKIIERRIKIGLSALVLFLLVVSSSSGILTITDEGLEFDTSIYGGGGADYVVVSNTQARNLKTGEMTTHSNFTDLMHTIMDEIYNRGSVAGGKILLQSRGYYILPNSPIIIRPGIIIEGTQGIKTWSSYSGTIIKSYLASGNAFSYNDADWGNPEARVVIKNMQFGSYGGTFDSFIYTHLGVGHVVSNCYFAGGVEHAIVMEGTYSTIVDCHIAWCVDDAVVLNTTRTPGFFPCNAMLVENCHIRGNSGDGIYIDEGATEVNIINSIIEGNSGCGINMGYDGDIYDGSGVKVTVRDCYFELNGGGNPNNPTIRLHEAYETLVDGCYFLEPVNNTFFNVSYDSGYRYLTVNNKVRNCYFVGYGQPVTLDGDNLLVDACTMEGINISWGRHVTVTNCNITNGSIGLKLNGTSTPDARIINNDINGTITSYTTDTVMSINTGFVTENYGTCTVANGGTYIIVNHGCDVTPNFVMVTPIETLNSASFWYVHSITSSQFNLTVNQNPGQDVDFVWWARYNP